MMKLKTTHTLRALLVLGIALTSLHTQAEPLTLVLAGDICLGGLKRPVDPRGLREHGGIIPFDQLLQKVAHLVDGDVNLFNLETVITADNSLPAMHKAFVFRSHPNSLKAILGLGFNTISLANNHAGDYKQEGVVHTLTHLEKLSQTRPLWFAGAGRTLDQATQPAVLVAKGMRIAFAAVGSGQTVYATPTSPGIAGLQHLPLVLKRLADTPADFKILSIHAGKVNRSWPTQNKVEVSRMAIRDYGVDLVMGHHAHVVQGVELYRGGLIFYDLGSFAFKGVMDIGKPRAHRITRDFGLVARLELDWTGSNWRFLRLVVTPLYDMHHISHPFARQSDAHARIQALNRISRIEHIEKEVPYPDRRSDARSPLTFTTDAGSGVFGF